MDKFEKDVAAFLKAYGRTPLASLGSHVKKPAGVDKLGQFLKVWFFVYFYFFGFYDFIIIGLLFCLFLIFYLFVVFPLFRGEVISLWKTDSSRYSKNKLIK